uniref:Uncharacterized protein n=1 Tax=Caenorhabditis japonica TaxID=281687 RepID=A0A8R1EG89_CAEJA
MERAPISPASHRARRRRHHNRHRLLCTVSRPCSVVQFCDDGGGGSAPTPFQMSSSPSSSSPSTGEAVADTDAPRQMRQIPLSYSFLHNHRYYHLHATPPLVVIVTTRSPDEHQWGLQRDYTEREPSKFARPFGSVRSSE